VICSL